MWKTLPARYITKKEIKKKRLGFQYKIYDNIAIALVRITPVGIQIFGENVFAYDMNTFEDTILDYQNSYMGTIKNYEGVFIPKGIDVWNNVMPDLDGNSILVKLSKTQYIFIGSRIYKFTTIEPITKYYSVLYSSAAHLPHAETKNYYYVLGWGGDGEWYIRKSKAGDIGDELPYHIPQVLGNVDYDDVTKFEQTLFEELIEEEKISREIIPILSGMYPGFRDAWGMHGEEFLFSLN